MALPQSTENSPIVLSINAMLGKEVQVVLATLIRLMAEKMEELLKAWFNGWIEIAVVRLYSQMTRGFCFPSPLRNQEPDWESGSGLGLAQ